MMSMTRKDYKIIADAVARTRKRLRAAKDRGAEYDDVDAIEMVIHQLSRSLKDDNIRFDSDKFYEACTAELQRTPKLRGVSYP